MEALECDRCKKRIGPVKDCDPEKDFSKAKVKKVDLILCADCTDKLDRFMANDDDLRTLKAAVESAADRDAALREIQEAPHG